MQVAKHWRMKAQRYYMGQEGNVPATTTQTEAEDFQFNGRGELYSYSTVYDAPAGYEGQAPYTVALIKLEEGPLVTAQLTDVDADELEIGMPLEMTTRKLRTEGEEGMILYGYKFRPRL